MTTDTLTLTDFLLARIAEDERLHTNDPDTRLRNERQCAAYRAIVEEHARETWGTDVVAETLDEPDVLIEECGQCSFDMRRVPFPCPTLRALASIWAEHPEWREEWRA